MKRIIKGALGLFKYWFKIGYAEEQVIKLRRKICKTCMFYDNIKLKCNSCGCGLVAKTSLESEVCPEDKW